MHLLFNYAINALMNKPYTVEEIKTKVALTARKYGIQKAYLFGSYARGDAGLESDIDICIEKGQIRTLLEFSGFCQDLEEMLEKKVDVITTVGIKNAFRNQIEKDMVLIYG